MSFMQDSAYQESTYSMAQIYYTLEAPKRLTQPATSPPPLNWQQFARDHGITGGNAGQIAKEFECRDFSGAPAVMK